MDQTQTNPPSHPFLAHHSMLVGFALVALAVILGLLGFIQGKQLLTQLINPALIKISTDQPEYFLTPGQNTVVKIKTTGPSVEHPLTVVKLALRGIPSSVTIPADGIKLSTPTSGASTIVRQQGTDYIVLIYGIQIQGDADVAELTLRASDTGTISGSTPIQLINDGGQLTSEVATLSDDGSYVSYPLSSESFFFVKPAGESPSAPPIQIRSENGNYSFDPKQGNTLDVNVLFSGLKKDQSLSVVKLILRGVPQEAKLEVIPDARIQTKPQVVLNTQGDNRVVLLYGLEEKNDGKLFTLRLSNLTEKTANVTIFSDNSAASQLVSQVSVRDPDAGDVSYILPSAPFFTVNLGQCTPPPACLCSTTEPRCAIAWQSDFCACPVPTPPYTPEPTDPFCINPPACLCATTGQRCLMPWRENYCACPSQTPPYTPAPTDPFLVCEYAAPPQGCRYIAGPNFDQRNNCGLVLECLSPVPSEIACPAEAKLCPDGSYVGRVAPNCEFAACPTSTSSSFSKVSPSKNQIVPYGPVTFSWTKHPDTNLKQYVLEIYDSEKGTPYIFQTYVGGNEITSTVLDLSVNSLNHSANFEIGKVYYWQVFANNGGSSQDIADNGEKESFIINASVTPTSTPVSTVTPTPSTSATPTSTVSPAPTPTPSASATPTPTAPAECKSLRGDLNCDGKVNIADLAKLSDFLLRSGLNLSPTQLANADLNGDNKVNIADITKLSDYLRLVIPSL